jgi:hypothetical protein
VPRCEGATSALLEVNIGIAVTQGELCRRLLCFYREKQLRRLGLEGGLDESFLRKRRTRGRFRFGHLLRNLANLFPEFVASGAGFGGEGKQASGGIFLGQFSKSVVELVVGEAIALGGDQQECAAGSAEKIQ